MKAKLTWTGNMAFDGTADQHTVQMDAKSPIGKDTAMTPKQMVLVGFAGCSAMDIVAYLKKYKQEYQSFEVEVEVQTSQGVHPAVFTKADLYYRLTGPVDHTKAFEAAHLSQTKYCGVSAMFSKAFPIEYHVFVNNEKVGSDFAKFE